MKTFKEYIEGKADEALQSVLLGIEGSVKDISNAITTAETGKAGTTNVYGEEQLTLDVLSDRLIQDRLKKVPAVVAVASEELPEKLQMNAGGTHCVAYDPLDGSSLVDVNFAVGSIFGVYAGSEFIGRKGEEQLAALIAIYGPKTTLIVTVKDTTDQFTLMNGEFVLTKENLKIEEGKNFAPGNLRACGEREDYLKLVEWWIREGYTLRYSGGFVPDINHILMKGKGVFTYPGHSKYPEGKLRLLFECAPMSLLVERAGGKSSDGVMRVLEKRINKLEQRTPILIGSVAEVDRAVETLQN